MCDFVSLCYCVRDDGTSCLWQGTLQEYDSHCLSKHNPFSQCPYYAYGCQTGKRLMKSDLKQHIIDSTHYHMTLLLKQVKHLTKELDNSQNLIQDLSNQVLSQQNQVQIVLFSKLFKYFPIIPNISKHTKYCARMCFDYISFFDFASFALFCERLCFEQF